MSATAFERLRREQRAKAEQERLEKKKLEQEQQEKEELERLAKEEAERLALEAAKLENDKVENLNEEHNQSPVDLEKLTVKELKELAKEKGIERYSDMKKEQLIEAVK